MAAIVDVSMITQRKLEFVFRAFCVLGAATAISTLGCRPTPGDAIATVRKESNGAEREQEDGNKIVLLIRADGDVQDKRIVQLLHTARVAVGDRAIVKLECTQRPQGWPVSTTEIWPSPCSPDSMKLLIRLAEAFRGLGVDRIKVMSHHGETVVDCDVYMSLAAARAIVERKSDHVRWYYADWSVYSAIAQQTILFDVEFWKLLTECGLPLALLNWENPSHELAEDFKRVYNRRVIPTIAVLKYREDKWDKDIFDLKINKDTLFAAIRATGDSR